MKNPRLIYRVILKSFALIGVVVLLYVMINSVFSINQDSKPVKKSVIPSSTVKVDLTGMLNNQIKKIRWNSRDVIILKRSTSEYSVFFNTGDSGNCPLFYNSKIFKDSCTGTKYNQKGLEINLQQVKRLKSPKYFIQNSFVIIGKNAGDIQQ